MPTYKYPRPAVTVDIVLFGLNLESERYDSYHKHEAPTDLLRVLLIRRKNKPFKNQLAFPGGFVMMPESLDAAAKRELKEETGLAPSHLEQLYTFGEPKRDPRERVISVAYLALVRAADFSPIAGSDAKEAVWMPVDSFSMTGSGKIMLFNSPTGGESLAFDHSKIFETALARLRAKIRYAPIGFDLMPRFFTLKELQRLYEAILGHNIDKGNFRRKLRALNFVVKSGETTRGRPGKPSAFYSFDHKVYGELMRRGFNFEL